MARIERTWRPNGGRHGADHFVESQNGAVELNCAAEDLAGQIAALITLAPTELLQKWKARFDTDPSPLLARIFTVRAIAYRL